MAVTFKLHTSSTTAISLAASLANNANTHSGHAGVTQTVVDNSTLKYPHAKFVLHVPETFAAAPSTGAYFDIWMTEQGIDGAADEAPLPGATDIVDLARYVGVIRIDNQDVAQRKPLIVRDCMMGVTSALFYIRNVTGQATTYIATPLTLKVTLLTEEDA